MALIPKIELCVQSSCQELVFKETTGAYSVSNVGGYGNPNPLIGDVTAASVLITNPGGTQYTVDLLATTYFPTTDTSYEYVIPMSSIGAPTTITDGQWTFVYTVTAGSVSYTATVSYIFTCNTECCVAKLLANIEVDDCDCNSSNIKKINDYLKARAFLSAMRDAAYCGNLSRYTSIKSLVDKICRKTDCKTCN